MNQLKKSLSIAIISVLLIAFSSCKEDNEDPLPTTAPTVITGDLSNVAATTATASGQVTDDGNAAVSERGVVIGATANPTITDTKVLSGSGEGTFTADLTGLTAGTSYHIRAFATNAEGTSYGLDKSFTTSTVLPTVTTTVATAITAISAVSGGNVSNDGGAAVTTRGICWSTNTSPTIANSKTTDGSGSGGFSSNLAGLNSSTKYYIRAYATNAVGTIYGNEISFTTLSSPVPTNGLIGWWPFNGNANDESGNANNGTINGATTTSDRFGKANSAYSFDGVNDFITCKNAGPVNNPTLTVSFWTKSISSNSGHLVSWGNNGVTGKDFRILSNAFNSCSGSISFDIYNSAKGYQNTFSQLEWEFYAIVYDGNLGSNVTIAKIYKNGVLITNSCFSESTTVGLQVSNLYPITFGKYHGTIPTDYLSGILDDIALWNRPLTIAEIQKIYDGTGF